MVGSLDVTLLQIHC